MPFSATFHGELLSTNMRWHSYRLDGLIRILLRVESCRHQTAALGRQELKPMGDEILPVRNRPIQSLLNIGLNLFVFIREAIGQ